MSDLKHQSVETLLQRKEATEKYIKKLQSTLNGEQQRLEWIEKYLYEKTPQEMSIEEIEQELGHKIIITHKGL